MQASYGIAQLGWSGTVDDASIYNRTLGSSEINTSFALEEKHNKDLVGSWLFDSNLSDSSQYHNDGEMQHPYSQLYHFHLTENYFSLRKTPEM